MIKQVDVLDLEINIVIDFMNIPRFQRLQTKKKQNQCYYLIYHVYKQ